MTRSSVTPEAGASIFAGQGALVDLGADYDAVRPHEVLDRGPLLEELGIRHDAVGRLGAACGQQGPEVVGIVAPVGDQPPGWSACLDQRRRHGDVVGIARGQQEDPGPARRVDQPVQLRRPAPARAPYAVREGPPFAPAAERCALMWVASIDTIPCGPWTPECPVSASKIACQMPCRDQRLKRL